MKKFYTFLMIMVFVLTMNAQYTYNDFDDNQNEVFIGWPNDITIVSNPNASGINTSANVAEYVRSETQWANVYCDIDGTIDFTTGNIFQLKVISPIACEVLFKLESANGFFTELGANITAVNEWTQLSYDFTGAESGLYNKIVIFFDFASTTDNTFYFDEVTGPEYAAGPTGDPVDLPVTFDDESVLYALTDFGGNQSEITVDPVNAENNVAKTVKTVGAETWAGTTVGGQLGFATPIPFTEGSTSMSVAIYSPSSGTPVRLKVEDAADPTKSVETETLTTVANGWEVMVFDFSNEATGTAEINFGYTYNKASIFFNFGTTGAQAGEQTYYWDDMEFVGGTGPKPLLAGDVQDNFEDDGWGNITDWKFQDPELVALPITSDPVNGTNHVGEYNRSGSFEWTNAQFILDHRMDLSTRNKFEIKVYFPSSNDYTGDLTPTAALKLQNSLLGGNAWTTQTEIKLDVTQFDSWVTLIFDFEAAAAEVNYDQIVVQFGGEGHLVPAVFYFDDLMLGDPSAIHEEALIETKVYPNPATDLLYLDQNIEFTQLSIYALSGQKVYQSQTADRMVDVRNLPAGVYTLQAVGADGKNYVAKFIKR